MLGEVEWRVSREGRRRGRKDEEEGEISRKKLEEVIKKLKVGKAVEEGGIVNEMWGREKVMVKGDMQ